MPNRCHFKQFCFFKSVPDGCQHDTGQSESKDPNSELIDVTPRTDGQSESKDPNSELIDVTPRTDLGWSDLGQ